MSLEIEREQTVQLLCRHFALDNLSTQDLETRLDAAYRAESAADLRMLTSGLPQVAMAAYSPPTAPAHAYGHGTEQRVLSVFSSVKKRGDWEPADEVHAKAIFGELVLDFREARLKPGVTTIHISAVFGNARIIVPPGLHVECDGSAFMGEFTHKTYLSADAGADAPTLRILGSAILGQVEVRMRLPDESALQALKREWSR